MRRTNLIQGAAVSLATALVLVGVAGAQPNGSTGRPQGTPITGTGWTFTVPPGWQNLQPPQATPPSMIVSSVAAPRTSRGRFPNVNLVVEPFTGGDGAAYGQAALTAVQQVATVVDSASGVSALPRSAGAYARLDPRSESAT